MEQTTPLLSSESHRLRWLCLGFLALVLLAFVLAPWSLMSKLRAVGVGVSYGWLQAAPSESPRIAIVPWVVFG